MHCVMEQSRNWSGLSQLRMLGIIKESSISLSENVSALILGVKTLKSYHQSQPTSNTYWGGRVISESVSKIVLRLGNFMKSRSSSSDMGAPPLLLFVNSQSAWILSHSTWSAHISDSYGMEKVNVELLFFVSRNTRTRGPQMKLNVGKFGIDKSKSLHGA